MKSEEFLAVQASQSAERLPLCMKNKTTIRLMLTVAFFINCSMVRAQDETIVFTPQWTAQAQFAGYYVAEAKGFYREAGVKVRIEHPSSTQPAITRLRNNMCQATTLNDAHRSELSGQCRQVIEEETKRGFRVKLII